MWNQGTHELKNLLLPGLSQWLRGGVQPLEPPELTDSEGVEALNKEICACENFKCFKWTLASRPRRPQHHLETSECLPAVPLSMHPFPLYGHPLAHGQMWSKEVILPGGGLAALAPPPASLPQTCSWGAAPPWQGALSEILVGALIDCPLNS